MTNTTANIDNLEMKDYFYDNLKIFCLNTYGFYRNRLFISSIINDYDILILVETWLTDGELIKNIIATDSHEISFRNATKAYDKAKGHGRGGICVLVRKNIKYKPRFHSNGICTINIKGTTIMGVYLPFNKKENESIFRLELEVFKDIVMECNVKDKDLIAIGDFNVDFKAKMSTHSKLLVNILRDTNMIPFDMIYWHDKVITYHKDNDKTHIDHVIGNENNNNLIDIFLFTDTSLNRSDHYGIVVTTKIKIDPNYVAPTHETQLYRYYWNMQYFINNYKNTLSSTLNTIYEELVKLKSVNVNNSTRSEKLHDLFMILHHDMKESADYVGDHVNGKIISGNIKFKPWFNDKILEMQKEANRLHENYLATKDTYFEDCSKEINKSIQKEIRESESKYKRNELHNLEKLRHHDSKKFWSILDSKINTKVQCETDLTETKNEFHNTFSRKLVHSDDQREKEEIKKFLEETENVVYDEKIEKWEVDQIVKELDNNKSVGMHEVSNEMIKNAPNKIIDILLIIIQLLINFGCVFDNFNVSIIKPIVKDINKALNSVNNVRPISVSDVFHTIMEKWLLSKLLEVYRHTPKQFGFRRGYSCQHAIVMVLETIKACRRKKKRLFLCLIDASKAFDKINRFKLWIILKNICRPAILRYLIKYYLNSFAYVRIDQNNSDMFKTELGVKQGGCLSPLLFAIYVADLSEIIDNLNIGVTISSQKINLIIYADDIALMCESKSDMEKLLKALDQYGKEKEIKFNGNKTFLMVFNKKVKKLNKKEIEEGKIILKLDNEAIIEVNEARYLGFILSTIKFNYAHINNRLSTYANKVFKLNKCDYDKNEMPSKTKSIIYKAHLRPLLLYGVDCMSLNTGEIKTLYTTEGNTLKESHNLYIGILSTEFFLALGMDITENVINLNRIKLFLRLTSCSYTRVFLQSIIDEHQRYPLVNTIINDVMKILNVQTMDLEILVEISKAYVNRTIKNFIEVKSENETVINLRYLLDKLPSSKQEIESIQRSYENVHQEDEQMQLNGIFLQNE